MLRNRTLLLLVIHLLCLQLLWSSRPAAAIVSTHGDDTRDDRPAPAFFASDTAHQHRLHQISTTSGTDRRPVRGPERIAVIGAGPGGSSFAYYAARAFPHAQIDVFEANGRAGGRCYSERLVISERLGLSILVESGASIFVEENQNLVRAARDFGLTFADDDDRLLAAHLGGRSNASAAVRDLGSTNDTTAASTMQVSIWNGTHTLFSLDLSGGWRSKFRGFWRYRFGPRTTARLADAAATKLGQVYTPGHRSYKSIDDLVAGLGLTRETKVSMREYVETEGINLRWADEVIEGVTRVNYGRDLNEVHALAALVGFVKGPTYSVREGNQRIYEEFLSRSKARPYFHANVTAITPIRTLPNSTDGPGYQLTYTNTQNGLATNSSTVYDTVVLALPPIASAMWTIDLPLFYPPPLVEAYPYHHIYVTFVLGKLNLTTFPSRPVQVLTTRTVPNVQSVSLVWDFGYQLADYGVGLYKVFSTKSLANEADETVGGIRRQLFARVDKVWQRQWWSYPVMQPDRTSDEGRFYPPIKVHEIDLPEKEEQQQDPRPRAARMYFLNGIERFVSTMETATVASRNLVRMLVDEVLGEDKVDGTAIRERDG